jgi:hypothetical protein
MAMGCANQGMVFVVIICVVHQDVEHHAAKELMLVLTKMIWISEPTRRGCAAPDQAADPTAAMQPMPMRADWNGHEMALT